MRSFDPARDGFGFRNPVEVPGRKGPEAILRPLDAFLYGNGLCFGMAVASLAAYRRTGSGEADVSGRRPTPEVLEALRGDHARQFRPRVVLAAVSDWLSSGGGKPDGLLERLRLPGEADPHVLNFGPAINRQFFHCMHHAHAVVPYRVERTGDEARVYVYDPNYPGDRGRFVKFRGSSFQYAGFRSREGWGGTLVPLSAVTA